MVSVIGGILWGMLAAAWGDEAAWRELSSEVLTPAQRTAAAEMVERDVVRRAAEANARNRAAWGEIGSREQWEAYRDERLVRLRRALGEPAVAPARLNVKVTATLPGEGYEIRNILYESRPGIWVAANLYLPSSARSRPPGILIAHSHHRDKHQSELQDMGMTWARAGCAVLVIDQFGYGERRLHPFSRAEDYAQPFPVSRQDYRFRYDSGIQLHLLGESLLGWMAWDLMRGVDLLMQHVEVDPQRIAILGAVAGGGDPAGVTAALDPRIAACVPFNFGGPQPETRYPLPDDAEMSFNYLGGSYWESTRGLRLGGRDDFPHWVIVGSLAPRRLIHAHEFAWDGERDPVWRRYQRLWGEFYQVPDRLAFAHGRGSVKQSGSEASHCTNIGAEHRRMIHPHFARWFEIHVTPEQEYSAPRKASELTCWTEAARAELQPSPVLERLEAIAVERATSAQRMISALPPTARRQALQASWERQLGPITPAGRPKMLSSTKSIHASPDCVIERIVLEVEPEIVIPLLMLQPSAQTQRRGTVIAVAQAGKAAFLQQRSRDLQACLDAGLTVVLPDVRGTGESTLGRGRGLEGAATNLSANLQLFGETLVGQRLRDLRSVIRYLESRTTDQSGPLVLWGDSFAPLNPAETNFRVPRSAPGWPTESEPLGGLLALLGALYEDQVRAVVVAGTVTDFRSVLSHFAVLVPHDAMIPGAILAGDLDGLAAGLAPLPLAIVAPVDHLNQPVEADAWQRRSGSTLTAAYASRPTALQFSTNRSMIADWIKQQIRP